MWETPFDESMLDSPVIIHCPEGHLANELMAILERHGVSWAGWDSEKPTLNSRWTNFGVDTCYWVESGSKTLTYGRIQTANTYATAGYIKCTFYAGYGLTDFEIQGRDAGQLLI